jgi:YhcH/YjgK/YiaL family protein
MKDKIADPSGEKKWINDQNKARWDKALEWLSQTDLKDIAPGKYHIDGDDVYASVAESPTKDQDEVKWEAHRKYADIQYVISGKEKMGVAPVSAAIPTGDFDEQKDLGFFTVPEEHCTYYTATSAQFFIFFPDDAHRPGIRITGCDRNKKVVVKVLL